MRSTDRALTLSVTVTVLGWIAAGAATSWITVNPHLAYPAIYLLWLHSFAIVATIATVMLVMLRAVQRMIGDTKQAYALGLEDGVEIRDSMAPPCPTGDSAPSSPETQKAPAAAGASR